MLTRAEFQQHTGTALLAAMHLPNWGALHANARRWAIVEGDGVFRLIPYKPAPFRGTMEDPDHAEALPPATFAREAGARLNAAVASR